MNAEEFREILVRDHSDDFAYSYFDRSEFREGTPPTLRPWSFVAERKFKGEAKRILQREGVKLLPADPEHMKPKMKRAA